MRIVRKHNIIGCAVWLSLLIGCGKQQTPPDEVYRQFHSALLRAGRGDPAAFQSAARHLSSATLSELQQRAEAVNKSLPDGAPKVDPRQMISIAGLESDSMPSDIEVTPVSHQQAELKVLMAGETHQVKMVLEKQQWKVELVITPPSPETTSNNP